MTPACDPARLNQGGKEVDCWLDPSGEEEPKFQSVEAGVMVQIVIWAIITCCSCCCFAGAAMYEPLAPPAT